MRRKLTATLMGVAMVAMLVATLATGQRAAVAEPAETDQAAKADQLVWWNIVVRTGNYRFAGTDARVFVRVFGTGTATRTPPWHDVELQTHGRLLERNTTWTYPILSHDVGHVSRVCLWRTNDGFGPDWYVRSVSVKDQLFTFYQWIPSGQWTCRGI